MSSRKIFPDSLFNNFTEGYRMAAYATHFGHPSITPRLARMSGNFSEGCIWFLGDPQSGVVCIVIHKKIFFTGGIRHNYQSSAISAMCTTIKFDVPARLGLLNSGNTN